MADADTRLKRQSATCMLVPSMLSGVYPDTSGVVQAEWQAVAWMYSGITAIASTVSTDPKWFKSTVRGTEKVTGKYVYIVGQIKQESIQATNKLVSEDSPYTVQARDTVLFCDTSSGAITVVLPAGIEGTNLKIVNCGVNDVTVDPDGTEELFGAGAGVASTLTEGENIDIHFSDSFGWW